VSGCTRFKQSERSERSGALDHCCGGCCCEGSGVAWDATTPSPHPLSRSSFSPPLSLSSLAPPSLSSLAPPSLSLSLLLLSLSLSRSSFSPLPLPPLSVSFLRWFLGVTWDATMLIVTLGTDNVTFVPPVPDRLRVCPFSVPPSPAPSPSSPSPPPPELMCRSNRFAWPSFMQYRSHNAPT
jgi:hypothetical protein